MDLVGPIGSLPLASGSTTLRRDGGGRICSGPCWLTRPHPMDECPGAADSLARLELRCFGVVQGVGLRPRLWLLARDLGLVGSLANVAGGVVLDLQ
ncbi:MAG: acylphosphatase, partial [bacterium]